MPNYFFTPETPVGATALAVIGKYWRILADLGESWQIFDKLYKWLGKNNYTFTWSTLRGCRLPQA